MTDSTAERRALLAVLLDRVERGVLLDNEAPLLRPLVQAEMDHGQAMIDQYVADAPWLKAREEDLAAETRRSLEAEAALARVRELAERWRYVPGLKDSPRTTLLRALDGPSPTPDDTPPTNDGLLPGVRIVNRGDAGWAWECHHCAVWSGEHYTSKDIAAEYASTKHVAHVGETDDAPSEPSTSNITDWASSVDEQCPARYKGAPPRFTQSADDRVDYRCERRGHGLDTNHAKRMDDKVVFCWTDAIAMYATSDAPAEQQ